MEGQEINTRTDEELMQRIAAGYPEAFNALYHRYHRRMYYYFFRMLNSREQANDFYRNYS